MAKPPAPTTQSAIPGAAEFSGNVLFYSKPEPLSREMHAKIGLRRMDKPFGFAATSNVVPLTVAEFPLAGLSYPVIFAGERYQPLAVMGVGQGQNLFVKPDGAFELGAYIPAYIRRYPFVLATDQNRGQLVVCIDRNASMLGEDYDLAFFDDSGQPTDYTNGCIQFCNDFETEGRRTESFVNLLKELDLFEVRRSTFTPPNADGSAGAPQPIAEYFAVSEDKVKALPPAKIQELLANGALAQIYAHLMSLAGWDRLIAMTLARQPQLIPANVN
ncbi:MAG TPA: SapC family protein [Caulobacteraceae bacterium]|nr:SapC family protein [Caulobacteraceae bacterium]